MEEYDPETDTWYDRADMASARYHTSTASEPRGHVFVAGGYGSEYGHAPAAYGTEGVLATFERYDPYAAGWVRVAPMPFSAYGVGLTTFDCLRRCKVLAAGGLGPSGRFLTSVAVYDPLPNTWKVASPLPSGPRFGITLLAAANAPRAYAVSGYELKLSPSTVSCGQSEVALPGIPEEMSLPPHTHPPLLRLPLPLASPRAVPICIPLSTSFLLSPCAQASSLWKDSLEKAREAAPSHLRSSAKGMSEEAAKRIADGAAKAAMQLHAPSIRQIFEYHLDSDSWWQVPSTRQWRLTRL